MPHRYGKLNLLISYSFVRLNRHLERARIIFAIENEMSWEERKSDKNKYWTTIDGQRYLQVEEIDKDCFRVIKNDD